MYQRNTKRHIDKAHQQNERQEYKNLPQHNNTMTEYISTEPCHM